MKTSGELRLIILVDVLCDTRSCKSSLVIGIVGRWDSQESVLLTKSGFFVEMLFICRAIVGQLTHSFHNFFSNGRKLNRKIEFAHGFILTKRPCLSIHIFIWHLR